MVKSIVTKTQILANINQTALMIFSSKRQRICIRKNNISSLNKRGDTFMLKKIIPILLTAAFLSGCRYSEDINISTEVCSSTDITVSSYAESTASQIADSGPDNVQSETYTVSSDADSSENTSKEKRKPNKAENSEKEETETSSETVTSEEVSAVSDNVNSKPQNEEPFTDDSVWISNRVLEILNSEREAIGKNRRTALPGLREIAVFRANQLVTQFSHLWTDDNGRIWDGARYASTVFKYGRYVDWAQIGSSEPTKQNYYSYEGGENIYYGGAAFRPKEEIAQSIVNCFKESTGHWNSLMSEKYNYDGVGVAFNNDMVYCSINSSYENYG